MTWQGIGTVGTVCSVCAVVRRSAPAWWSETIKQRVKLQAAAETNRGVMAGVWGWSRDEMLAMSDDPRANRVWNQPHRLYCLLPVLPRVWFLGLNRPKVWLPSL